MRLFVLVCLYLLVLNVLNQIQKYYTLKMETIIYSETVTHIYQITELKISEKMYFKTLISVQLITDN
jgi:hypothetical protein